MDSRQKVLNLIGLATKAGKSVSGEFSTEKSVKSGRAQLVIVSEEASENTKKMFTNMCTYYKVPICYFGKKEELGHAMGRQMRASRAIVEKGLAEAIMKQMLTVKALNSYFFKQIFLFPLPPRRRTSRFPGGRRAL